MSDLNQDQLEEFQKSKINSGGLINLRMHELWQKAHEFAVKGNYPKWNAYLDRIWMELSGDAKQEDEKAFFDIALGLPEQRIIERDSFEKPTIEERLIRAKQYMALLKKETFLRRLQNEQGKGTAYAEEEEDWE